jgi:tetratricopeptide (TPR) repeat protein
MLETIREFAVELLEASGEAETVRRRHCEHILGEAERGAAAWHAGAEAHESLFAVLDEDHDNLRAALGWAAASGEVELEVRLAVAARWYWVVQGNLSEGRRFFESVLEHTAGAPKELRARALVHAAIFPFRLGDNRLAEGLLQESLDLYRQLGDEEGIARATAELGGIAIAEGDLDRATALYEESLPLLRKLGNLARVAVALGNLGTIAHMRAEYETAVDYYDESIEASRSAGDSDGVGVNLHNLARSELALGRVEPGVAALRESLGIARNLGYRELIAYLLGGFAEVAMIEDEPARAATLLGASDQLFSEIGAIPSPDEAEVQERVAAYVLDALGAERVAELRAAGAASTLDDLLEDVASGA